MKISAYILVFGLVQVSHAQDVSGDAEKGEHLYYNFACYSCHGYNATMRVPLVGDVSGIMSNEQLFLSYLRLRGDQNPVNPTNSMPNYSENTLSDEQALDIYAYVKSLPDDPPQIEDIPVLVEIMESAKQRARNETNEQ